ncbi:Hpt domain-containing protein [Candidatus Woesearchaeota archaeon]|nr:Hpt domain-containing protein [Candidatus Woesearchaeota archaeon]
MNEEYLEPFLEEAESQISCLKENIEKVKTEQNNETFQTIRRCAHTLKGSSAIMELTKLSELCKMVEYTGRDLAEGKLGYDESVQASLDKVVPTLVLEVENIKTNKADGLPETGTLTTELQARL